MNQLCSGNDRQNVCTLTSNCIQTNDKEGNGNTCTSIMHNIIANQKVMMTTDCLRLTDSCKKYT